jgi:hypothetical protein
MNENFIEWMHFLFVTNGFLYLSVLLFNIVLFVLVMVYRPDVIGYSVGFFFLSILGARVVIRNG